MSCHVTCTNRGGAVGAVGGVARCRRWSVNVPHPEGDLNERRSPSTIAIQDA